MSQSSTNSANLSWQVLHSTGNDEWYTPPEIIELARAVLGNIDLDPASSPVAQSWIQADRFHTLTDDGLSRRWEGRLWLNPPYSNTGQWVIKAAAEYTMGNVTEAILLVKPAISTSWYQGLDRQYPKCSTDKRIKFLSGSVTGEQPRKRRDAPAHGNCLFYLGSNTHRFWEVFSPIGSVSVPYSYLLESKGEFK